MEICLHTRPLGLIKAQFYWHDNLKIGMSPRDFNSSGIILLYHNIGKRAFSMQPILSNVKKTVSE